MKRLKLNVDDLLVESFNSTDAPAGQTGTVHGHGQAGQATYACTEGWYTCFTDADTCAHTCLIQEATGCNQYSQCLGWCESEHGCSGDGSCMMTACFTCNDPTCVT
jgi:hypothetical protein